MSPSLVHPSALVDPQARVGEGVEIGPFTCVEAGAVIGDACRLGSHVRIASGTVLGRGCRVLQGAAIGGLPQILGFQDLDRGICELGEAVTVGEFATIHAGSSPDSATRIGARCFLMAYSHVGHDCALGEDVVMANAVQLGGHVTVGRGAFLGGSCVIHQFCQVGELAFVAGGIPVDRDVLPWSRVIGNPAAWARMNLVGLRRAGWSSEEIAEAGRWLRPFAGRGRVEEAYVRTLACSESLRARELATFVLASKRGMVRARL